MKKTFTVILWLSTVLCGMAQLSISTGYRQDAVWNDSTGQWTVYFTDGAETLFEFNREFTLFKHTTPDITSLYTINNWEYSDSSVQYRMDVTSDAGNTYELIIDGIENCVAFFFWYDDRYILVRHTIKKTWFKEN